MVLRNQSTRPPGPPAYTCVSSLLFLPALAGWKVAGGMLMCPALGPLLCMAVPDGIRIRLAKLVSFLPSPGSRSLNRSGKVKTSSGGILYRDTFPSFLPCSS